MAAAGFGELALQYVLSDEPEQAKAAAQKAASMIEASTNNRMLVGQWVSSIQRWMPSANSGDDGQVDDGDAQEDDLISRAKALDFLASTLAVLKRDTLRADQVQLLANFFCSLFSSDHKAGITASVKALRQLPNMKTFQPLIANDIIEAVCKLGDDFKLQPPATRLEIYQLILELLQDQSVSNELEYKHGNTCGFITRLLDLCRNERDPNNLMKWFETLKIFLQNFSPLDDVTSEVFKTFSAYFPISLRASATPSGIRAEDLKSALRSCFAAHHRLAGHAIPYLIAKLDQGDAVTVAVKVDILQTLDACVNQYSHPNQSVIPYVDQIWSSLKYEVRNGEVPDTIEATLKVITSLTRRLDEDDLRSFFNTAWRDLAEDVANPTYAAQAGRLLVAILGASVKSFSMIAQALTLVKNSIESSKSASHQRDLLALLNSILLVRSHLVANGDVSKPLENPLRDDLFGDSLFFDTFQPLWTMSSDYASIERVEIFNKIMEGMAALVDQKSYGSEPRRLTTDSTCAQILKLLSEFTIVRPLEGGNQTDTTQEALDNELRTSATSALKKAVPEYPEGFRQLLLLYIESIQRVYETRTNCSDFVLEIKQVAITLCDVAYPGGPRTSLPLTDYMSLIHAFLNGFCWMLACQAPPKYWSAFISSINLAVLRSLRNVAAGYAAADMKPQPLSAEVYAKLAITYDHILQNTLYEEGTAESLVELTGYLDTTVFNEHQQLLAYCVFVLKKLYCRFTDIYPLYNGTSGKRWCIGLHKDFVSNDWKLVAQQDICLHQLALLATSVVRALSEDEQKSLMIDREIFHLFNQSGDYFRKFEPGRMPTAFAAKFSPIHDYRTAPLSMGILQGLFPGALDYERHVCAIRQLKTILVQTPTVPTSEITRVSLDTMWTILANKFVIKGDQRKSKWLTLQSEIVKSFEKIWGSNEPKPRPLDAIRVLRSVIHFLSGDIARFQGDPKMNGLLRLVCDNGPSVAVMGRQLAKNFEILLSPQECLRTQNHAARKRLSEAWIYHQAVRPYLWKCFPEAGNSVEEQEAVNRAVATFAMLKYAKYEYYSDDVGTIVRIAIRSIGTFEQGVEMASCLTVLLDILEKDPDALKGHLASLIKGMINVYNEAKAKSIKARVVTEAPTQDAETESPLVSPHDSHALNTCRKLVLEFFGRLPSIYEAHALIPYRKQLLRPLSTACGDPVRELRRIALAARQAWENLN